MCVCVCVYVCVCVCVRALVCGVWWHCRHLPPTPHTHAPTHPPTHSIHVHTCNEGTVLLFIDLVYDDIMDVGVPIVCQSEC